MKRTALPVIAGILSILSGALSLVLFVAFLIASIALGSTVVNIVGWVPGIDVAFGITLAFSLLTLVTGGIALMGGTFALRRRTWGWALAGSIAAIVPTLVLGVVSITLIAAARDEFEQPGDDGRNLLQTNDENAG